MILNGLSGDFAYVEELHNNPPPGISYDVCLPEEFSGTPSVILKEKIERYDLVHFHSWFPPCDNRYTVGFFRNLKRPLLCSFATTMWDCRRLYFKTMPYIKMAKCILYSRLMMPECFIAWSEKAKSRAIKQFHYSPEKIHVLPPFIRSRPVNAKIDRQEITIGFIGDDFERKGGPLLLEAFKALRKERTHLNLKIISGHKIEDSKNIKSYGRKTRDELFNSFYPDCDLFVLPTRVDFFGMAILEAMSFGIPVITTDIYAMDEIIDNGKDGFLVPSNDLGALIEKIDLLIKDNDLRERMGIEAKNKILKRFSPQTIGKKLKLIYEQCIQND